MANEVVIEEYATPALLKNGQIVPVYSKFITSQVLDTAELSAAFSSLTKMISVVNKSGAGLWIKLGDSSVSAVADTAGNRFLKDGERYDTDTDGHTYIDTAADA